MTEGRVIQAAPRFQFVPPHPPPPPPQWQPGCGRLDDDDSDFKLLTAANALSFRFVFVEPHVGHVTEGDFFDSAPLDIDCSSFSNVV